MNLQMSQLMRRPQISSVTKNIMRSLSSLWLTQNQSFKKLLRQDFMHSIKQSAISTVRVLSCATPESGAYLLTIPKTPKMSTTSIIFQTMILGVSCLNYVPFSVYASIGDAFNRL